VETVRIYRLDNLPPSVSRRLYDAQLEAARVWNLCRDIHNQGMSQWEYGKHIDYLRYKFDVLPRALAVGARQQV